MYASPGSLGTDSAVIAIDSLSWRAEPLTAESRDLLADRAALLETTGDGVRLQLERFNADGSRSDDKIKRIAEELTSANDLKAMAAFMRSVPEFIPDRRRLRANAVPSACVIGENDPNLPGARATAQHMANLRVQVLKGENHITAFQSPEFLGAVKAFLTHHGDTSECNPQE